MAKICYGELFSVWILFWVIITTLVVLDCHGYVEGRKISNEEYINIKQRGTIKTIRSFEDGDVIDCVDIHKQPALDHPLIKELQMEPSISSTGSNETTNACEPELFQAWRKNEECPEGTIPIRRTQNFHMKHNFSVWDQKQPNGREYAVVNQRGTGLHGARASINVWSPRTEANEISVNQIWVEADTGDVSTRNTIEAGWIVYPERYHDTRPRFFTFWTGDNYRNGCYDINCPGFVQTSRKFALGSPIAPVSTYGGKSFDISVNIYKDKSTGNWWLQLQGETIGYWPKTIFTTLANGASRVTWGGEVSNFSPGGHHTTTQMGSGHFSSEGYGKASYFRNLQIIDSGDRSVDPDNLRPVISEPDCYDLTIRPKAPNYGTYFYYGGPGFSPKCQ